MNLKNIGIIGTILSIVLLTGCASSPKVQKTEKKFSCVADCGSAEQPQAESPRQAQTQDRLSLVVQNEKNAARLRFFAEREWALAVQVSCSEIPKPQCGYNGYEMCVKKTWEKGRTPGGLLRPPSLSSRSVPRGDCVDVWGRR